MLTLPLVIILLIYLLLIAWLNSGFNKVDHFKLQDFTSKTRFSIVIPFRNETKNLSGLLRTISELNYPKHLFEILFIDDDSEDDSVKLIKNSLRSSKIDFKIIKNERASNSPKKDAITKAITLANYKWIITTDADCFLPKYWLDAYDEFIQTHPCICIAGPVKFLGASSFFNRFQIMDALSLQGATIGGFGIQKPFLCNGANFAYKVSEFKAVNGFSGNTTVASGDDVFLLEKLLKLNKNEVHYLKSEKAIVSTKVVSDFKTLVQQRLRWASKLSHYNSWFAKGVGSIVFLCNCICISLIPLTLLGVLNVKTALLLVLMKFCIDLLLLFKSARFFKQETILLSYAFASLIYPFFNSYIAILSLFTTYQWKGRTFKK